MIGMVCYSNPRGTALLSLPSLLLMWCMIVFSLYLNGEALAYADDLTRQGEYVLHAAGCSGCHTDRIHHGGQLAGGMALSTPFGTFYTPNITPDLGYGIGRWSEQDFVRALTEGVSPNGSSYYPVFPYTSYTQMSRSDVHALWIYLRSVPAVAQANKTQQPAWYLNRTDNWIWQQMYFRAGTWQPQAKRSQAWNHGAYIVKALGHCGECHTPRNIMGAMRLRMAYAGTNDGPDGTPVPNITSDPDTGIGSWTKSDLLAFVQDGSLPNGDYTGGIMAEIVENSLSHLNITDVEALVEYIATIPPIHNVIAKQKRQ